MGDISEEHITGEPAPLFQARAQVRIAAPPHIVYAVVSDLTRSAEWSAECVGGEWVSGEPGTVGAVFRGENYRAEDVVGWAPVVRGVWHTESEVITAEPDRTFRWSICNKAGVKQDSIWSFEIEPAAEGSVLVHQFRMGEPTEGILGITADMDETQKRTFTREWGDKVVADLETTVQRIRDVVEKEHANAAHA